MLDPPSSGTPFIILPGDSWHFMTRHILSMSFEVASPIRPESHESFTALYGIVRVSFLSHGIRLCRGFRSPVLPERKGPRLDAPRPGRLCIPDPGQHPLDAALHLRPGGMGVADALIWEAASLETSVNAGQHGQTGPRRTAAGSGINPRGVTSTAPGGTGA